LFIEAPNPREDELSQETVRLRAKIDQMQETIDEYIQKFPGTRTSNKSNANLKINPSKGDCGINATILVL
jgi:hypothetical protein